MTAAHLYQGGAIKCKSKPFTINRSKPCAEFTGSHHKNSSSKASKRKSCVSHQWLRYKVESDTQKGRTSPVFTQESWCPEVDGFSVIVQNKVDFENFIWEHHEDDNLFSSNSWKRFFVTLLGFLINFGTFGKIHNVHIYHREFVPVQEDLILCFLFLFPFSMFNPFPSLFLKSLVSIFPLIPQFFSFPFLLSLFTFPQYPSNLSIIFLYDNMQYTFLSLSTLSFSHQKTLRYLHKCHST